MRRGELSYLRIAVNPPSMEMRVEESQSPRGRDLSASSQAQRNWHLSFRRRLSSDSLSFGSASQIEGARHSDASGAAHDQLRLRWQHYFGPTRHGNRSTSARMGFAMG